MPDRSPMSQMMRMLLVREGIHLAGSASRFVRSTAVEPLIDGEVAAWGLTSMSTSKSSSKMSVGSASYALCSTPQG